MFPRFTLALTRNPRLTEELLQLCPVLTVETDVKRLDAHQWERAAVVIVGTDMLAEMAACERLLPRARAVLVVNHDSQLPLPGVREVLAAERIGAEEYITHLPGGAEYLRGHVAELVATRGRLVVPEDVLDVASGAHGPGFQLYVLFVEEREWGVRTAIGHSEHDQQVRSVPLDGTADFTLVERLAGDDPRFCRHGVYVGHPDGPGCGECEDGAL